MTKEEIKNYLLNLVEENKMPHSIIIDGVVTEDDKEPAFAFTKKVMGSVNNLDVIIPVHEKENLISVDEVRKQIVDNAYMKPYANDHKFYLIDANLINEKGQNALLKVLEEPPAYAIFILFVKNISAILDTVKSRCQVLSLTNEQGTKTELAHETWRIAEIAVALPWATFSEAVSFTKEIIDIVKETGMTYFEIFDIIRKLYRDAVAFKEGVNAKKNFSNADDLINALQKESEKEMFRQLDLLEKAELKLRYQVNIELLLKDMFMNWRIL